MMSDVLEKDSGDALLTKGFVVGAAEVDGYIRVRGYRESLGDIAERPSPAGETYNTKLQKRDLLDAGVCIAGATVDF